MPRTSRPHNNIAFAMTKEELIRPENLVYAKPRLLNDSTMHYCPGCSHGVVHKLLAEVIDEMGLADRSIGISPVGCAVFAYKYIDIDWQEAAHGRAPALATACKRLWPDRLVFTYQGDGDLATPNCTVIRSTSPNWQRISTAQPTCRVKACTT